ncbi:FliH/SctL family protein [Priestia megaterium]|uniref:FliH/SctL family protein n=1 Tax=Priestia megaterium TaxID=1404 RepID=UPI002E2015C2|nr:FliH/SctL family protein [Priestia megaterium]
MSFSNSKIIKKTNRQQKAVHVDEHLASFQDDYYSKTSRKRLEEFQKEIDSYRKAELEKVKQEAAIIRENAYIEGKEQALNELRPESEAKAKEELSGEFEKVFELYQQANSYSIEQKALLDDKKQEWLKSNENDIVSILISAVEKIIASQVHIEAEDVKAIIQQSISEVNDVSKTIWVRVNPDVKRKIDSQKWDERKIEWISDPTLSYLDVLVETESEWIDSTVQNKIENLKKIIEEWVENNDLLSET